ncbi:MAG: hypothetical protein HRU50_03190 [Winogradskyella sp.]|uniref:hypothetical protein n=1 Tax=Winogradskyella sp. TaxID=1883156 RepID=UPI0025F0BEAB|nr:hypothetical protein [Winogradskyella sp.]NRB58929.1 hypothetical protein [Winogradskyella sp.]
MKKQVLFMAMVLLGITSATATTAGYAVSNGEDLNKKRYHFTQPITFVERGIEFLIFPDGSFDFNTDLFNSEPYHDDFYYKRNRRNINRTYGAPRSGYSENGGILIRHNRFGQVRRIGNVFLNYDRQGRLKRVGTLYITYRRGRMTQVGGLRLLYNRHGEIIGSRGQINFNNTTCGLWDNEFFNSDYTFNDYDFNPWESGWESDNDYFYYRKNGKVKRHKKVNSQHRG